MITGTVGTNNFGNKHILLLINRHPVVVMKVRGLISGCLIIKIHGVSKSLLVSLRKQRILINYVSQLNEDWLRASCVS